MLSLLCCLLCSGALKEVELVESFQPHPFCTEKIGQVQVACCLQHSTLSPPKSPMGSTFLDDFSGPCKSMSHVSHRASRGHLPDVGDLGVCGTIPSGLSM